MLFTRLLNTMSGDKLKTLVFVYGTLKKGEPNHYLMAERGEEDAKFMGKAKTEEKYPLVIASKYNIPYLLDRKGVGHNVEGEVYSVSDAMLRVLDELEGHPTYYTRRTAPIKMESSEVLDNCWVYLLPKFREILLNEGEYLQSYSSSGPHQKPYVASEDTSSENDIYS